MLNCLKKKELSGMNTSLTALFEASKIEKRGKKIGMTLWIKIVFHFNLHPEVLSNTLKLKN